jgi:hypothetical protein
MLKLTGYAREKRQLDVVTFRIDQTPSQIKLQIWDYNHDGERVVEIQVWYKEIQQHDYFKFKTVDAAVAELVLAENFLGKKIS